MGGDAWWQSGSYQPDPVAAFRQAQEAELARDDRGFGNRGLDELWQDEAWIEYIFTGGTGTVLDQVRLVAPGDADEFAMMRPLSEKGILAWAPGGRPTRAQWAEALESERLPYPGRACGRCTVLYSSEGRPVEIGYWGVTAD